MKRYCFHKILYLLLLTGTTIFASAQRPGNILKGIGNRIPGVGSGTGNGPTGSSGGGATGDSLLNRSKYEDSITVRIFYLDSAGAFQLDTSINDFTNRFPIPATHVYMGNNGSATRSILFQPVSKAGFDPGFHAFDTYKWTLDKVRFFNTTRPYTELGYVLASRSEQIIEILHTQNFRPYWNISLNYRLINAPGFFRNQKTNHNNYQFTSWYQSPNKRYNNYFVLLGNRLQAGENGGIRNTADLDELKYAKDRSLIATNIGGDQIYGTDFFNTTLTTGNRYREFNIFLRQQYDFGKKDSLVTDSTVIPLFFPRLRLEHNFTFGTYKYQFQDLSSGSNTPDSAWYHDHYGIQIPSSQSLLFYDRWKEIKNDFSIYQFPEAHNLHQFIKLGAEFQLLHGQFFRDSAALPSASFFNTMAHGEYRNLTRNRKWDMLAQGKVWLSGYNLGDYQAIVKLKRLISQKLGSFELGFENINRTPPFLFDPRSGFYLDAGKNFKKENTTHLFAGIFLNSLKLQLTGHYFLVSNYLYLKDYYKMQQEGTLFNVIRIDANKTFRIGRHWYLRSEVWLQQKTGSAEINLPVVYTRNRFDYEGNLGFPNLHIAMGLESRYHTPYQADNYSPLNGQFFYQDSVTISNLPELHAYIHFRIRSFKGYIRAENLNTVRNLGGLQFNNNNLAAPYYPTPGMILRFGVYWSFVN